MAGGQICIRYYQRYDKNAGYTVSLATCGKAAAPPSSMESV